MAGSYTEKERKMATQQKPEMEDSMAELDEALNALEYGAPSEKPVEPELEEEGQKEEESEEETTEQETEQVEPEQQATQNKEAKVFREEDFNSLRSVKDREIHAIRQKLEKYEAILQPVANWIERDVEGNPIGVRQPPPSKDEEPKIEYPTQDEWEDDPVSARIKERKAIVEETRQAARVEFEKEQALVRERQFNEVRQLKFQEAIAKSQKEFPDFNNPESEFYKRGMEIAKDLADENPAFINNPSATYFVNKLVAAEFALKGKGNVEKTVQKQKQKPNRLAIMQTQGGSNVQDSESDSIDAAISRGDEEAFVKFLNDNLEFK